MHISLLGCRHVWSRVFTLRDKSTNQKRTYKVCLDCGKERDYDMTEMRFTEVPVQHEREEVEVCT